MATNPILLALEQYVSVVDDYYGHYLDSRSGFQSNVQRVEEAQQGMGGKLAPGTNPDDLPFYYGLGSPNDPANVMLHVTTQGIYKGRNSAGGQNERIAARVLIVMVYEHWETEHRARIAAALGCERDALKVPVVGDLRLLRHDILHHQAVITAATEKRLSVLGGIPVDVPLSLSPSGVETIVRLVKSGMDKLAQEAGLPDPTFRKTWRVT